MGGPPRRREEISLCWPLLKKDRTRGRFESREWGFSEPGVKKIGKRGMARFKRIVLSARKRLSPGEAGLQSLLKETGKLLV